MAKTKQPPLEFTVKVPRRVLRELAESIQDTLSDYSVYLKPAQIMALPFFEPAAIKYVQEHLNASADEVETYDFSFDVNIEKIFAEQIKAVQLEIEAEEAAEAERIAAAEAKLPKTIRIRVPAKQYEGMLAKLQEMGIKAEA